MARLNHNARLAHYGAPCQAAHRTTVTTPWGIRVVVHELVAARFEWACKHAAARSLWIPRRIDSYNCRKIRGSSSYSLHSWPLAWDFFDKPYPEPVDVWGPANAPDEAFRNAFKDVGFHAGADFSGRKDYPHIEWAAAPPREATPVTPQEAMMRFPNAVDACRAPKGGVWVLGRDGGIGCFGDAPMKGSYPGLPPAQRQGDRAFLRIEANANDGYDIIADDGSLYSFPIR